VHGVYTNIQLALNALYVFAALNMVFIVVIYTIKLRNINRKKLHDRFQLQFKDYLIYVQANLEDAERLRVPPTTMNSVESEALQERLYDMIECFSGEQRQKLKDLCEDLGFVKRHTLRLNGQSYREKLDAAYHLGCMRVKEAVPALLELLNKHERNSSLFVIARAIAKCARNEQDIKEMIHTLLKHNKKFYDLIVDIIEEADVDQAALFTEFVNDKEPAYIQIGIIGLKDYTNPGAASAVYRLMDSANEDIQRRAVEVYLKSSHLLPKNLVSKLLSHKNADIRYLTTRTLSDIKNTAYVELMTNSLSDEDQRVAYSSAKGLMRLGQEGIVALCEAARDTRGTGRGEAFQRMIEEEIKQLSMQLHDLDKLTRYNQLMYTYEKIFSKNKRIYRVV
jgi:HEAT repeat protein